MHLLCVLQTHTLSNNQDGKGLVRYGSSDKAEITKRCVRSLVSSMNYAQTRLPNFKFELQVLDDHSDEKSIEILKQTLETAQFKTSLDHLETRGIMPSILKCYEYGHEHGQDLVYFVQDDYLYDEPAIYEMVLDFVKFSQSVGNWVALYPFDDPWSYTPDNVSPTIVILGKRRHWRRNFKVASPFMVHIETLRKQWDLFYAMGTHEITGDMEENTINKLFHERGVMLFTPIPSLALHFQYDMNKDPYIDWKRWWDKYSDTTGV